MIRSEIKNFTVSFGKCGSFPCTPPCTLFSVLSERGIYNGVKNEEERAAWQSYIDSPCDFDATFVLTQMDLERRYIYLCLSRLDTVAEIYLNDSLLKIGRAHV